MLLRRLYPAGPEGGRHIVKFYGKVAIGASGAVGTQFGKGFSVAKAATGRYTVTLAGVQGSVGKILYTNARVVSTTRQIAYTRAENDTTGVVTFSTATAAAADTEADPAEGDVLEFTIAVRAKSSEQS